MAPNCPEYGVIFHAVALAGGVITTVNPTYTPGEVHHQLVDSGATRLVTIPMFLETATAAIADSAVKEVYVIGEADGYTSIASLAGAPLAEQVPVDLDDVVVLPYSSGTTGLAKGVMLTHRNLVSNIEQTLGAVTMRRGRRLRRGAAVLPHLRHAGAHEPRACAPAPRSSRCHASISSSSCALHQEHRLTRAFVAPPMVVALAKHPVVDNYDLSALRWILSARRRCRPSSRSSAAERLGCEVVQGYGMTELSPVSHATPSGMFKPGSVGVTVPNTEVNIVDPATESPLGIDEDGEVWVRGPQVMKGYLNNEAATKNTIDDDGWLHTGDIGHIDADGHLFIVDRLKELIKYKGFQVPPAELEALLLTHPQIADAAVIGLPDDEAGEIPAAYVVLKQGQDATAADIQGFVAEKVASYKQVRKLTFVDAIPKSASGKILRRVLRDQAPQ